MNKEIGIKLALEQELIYLTELDFRLKLPITPGIEMFLDGMAITLGEYRFSPKSLEFIYDSVIPLNSHKIIKDDLSLRSAVSGVISMVHQQKNLKDDHKNYFVQEYVPSLKEEEVKKINFALEQFFESDPSPRQILYGIESMSESGLFVDFVLAFLKKNPVDRARVIEKVRGASQKRYGRMIGFFLNMVQIGSFLLDPT